MKEKNLSKIFKIPLNKVIQTQPCPQKEKILRFIRLLKLNGTDYFPPICCKYSKSENLYYILDGTYTSLAKQEMGCKYINGEAIVVDSIDKTQLLF